MPTVAPKSAAVVTTRLKREDHKRTKHDSHFSKWKILIGSDDWEDHSAGKEGVARYRVENLPRTSRSGLYELAVYRAGSSSGDNPGRVDPHKVLVVYIGEADNVRTRLQQYGRTGAHLGRSCFGDKGHGCFEDIFSRGYSIAYRWAPMENKVDAQKTEAQLLDTFDYAWNKGSNGVRRHEDILQKLDKDAPNPAQIATFWRKLLPFHQKRVGIDIKSCKLLADENEFSKYANAESYNILSQVFKFSSSRPKLVLELDGSNDNDTIICGVVSADGTICERPPVEGRKRCTEHKGKKTKGSSVLLSTSEKSQMHLNHGSSTFTEYLNQCSKSSSICGAPTRSGSPCQRTVNGKGRCWQHLNHGSSTFTEYSNQCSESSSICGAATRNGSSCKRTVNGNGRCWQHLNYGIGTSNVSNFSTKYSNYGDSTTSICGAPTRNDSFCRRTVKGNGMSEGELSLQLV